MNSNSQAQKGFKTFILTLVISLVVFSAIYYVVNSDSSVQNSASVKETSNVESKTDSAKTSTLGDASLRTKPATTPVESTEKEEVAGAKTETAQVKDDSKSVFQELASTEMNVAPTAVLAEADEGEDAEETQTVTEESTVPDTGIMSPTFGIFFSMLMLSIFAYIVFLGPRKMALDAFEKKVLEDLD